jgi:hypothetical protein
MYASFVWRCLRGYRLFAPPPCPLWLLGHGQRCGQRRRASLNHHGVNRARRRTSPRSHRSQATGSVNRAVIARLNPEVGSRLTGHLSQPQSVSVGRSQSRATERTALRWASIPGATFLVPFEITEIQANRNLLRIVGPDDQIDHRRRLLRLAHALQTGRINRAARSGSFADPVDCTLRLCAGVSPMRTALRVPLVK